MWATPAATFAGSQGSDKRHGSNQSRDGFEVARETAMSGKQSEHPGRSAGERSCTHEFPSREQPRMRHDEAMPLSTSQITAAIAFNDSHADDFLPGLRRKLQTTDGHFVPAMIELIAELQREHGNGDAKPFASVGCQTASGPIIEKLYAQVPFDYLLIDVNARLAAS
jgi:hypothetical protein